MSEFEFIRDRVPKEELLAQLAEEAAELCHAALKLRRVYDGVNPTPITEDEALAALNEEIADVALLISVLGLVTDTDEYVIIMSKKLTRWVDRLRDAEEEADGA